MKPPKRLKDIAKRNQARRGPKVVTKVKVVTLGTPLQSTPVIESRFIDVPSTILLKGEENG